MKNVIQSIKEYCTYNYESIAVAENITSGSLQLIFGAVPEAREYFKGGITAWNHHQLASCLDVPPFDNIANPHQANLSMTIELAKAVAKKFNSDIGIVINGTATNAGGLYQPAYAVITRFNKLLYAEKLVPYTRHAHAVPLEFAQRVIKMLASKLIPEPEDTMYTTAEILEPLS
jgi:nicotinamide-nucleotide amidase